MSLKLKLKMLSKKMKMLGNMHPDYKGLSMYSEVSPYIMKSTLLYFIKFFMQEISIIFIDSRKEKITWYNKTLYHKSKKAIVCVDDKYCICLRENVLINAGTCKTVLLDIYIYLEKFNILEDEIVCDQRSNVTLNNSRRPKDQSLFIALVNYQCDDVQTEDQSKSAEALRLKLGEHLHNYLLLYNKTPADVAAEFDTYLEDKYEKIVYVIC